MADDEVTKWLATLQAESDDTAMQKIWEHYFDGVVRLARRHLTNVSKRVTDEEDVAVSAMNSFYRGVRAGKFPRLTDRNDLWKLLVTITARKATAQRRKSRAQKRGAGAVRGESFFMNAVSSRGKIGLDRAASAEPTPEFAAQVAETCGELLNSLEDSTLRKIALQKFEGYTNNEIAEKMGVTQRTVERKLDRIRTKWSSKDISL